MKKTLGNLGRSFARPLGRTLGRNSVAGASAGGSGMLAPSSLFVATEDNAWYKIQTLTTLKQNSNGTTAVTVVTDPVGYVASQATLSLATYNATQATAGSRPLLAQRLGQYILQADYIDDSLGWGLNGKTGTFFGRSPFGSQVFTLDATAIVPQGQWFELGFIGRVINAIEKQQLLAYLDAQNPAGTGSYDQESVGLLYTNGTYYSGNPPADPAPGGTLTFSFSDNQSTSGPPWPDDGGYTNHFVLDSAPLQMTLVGVPASSVREVLIDGLVGDQTVGTESLAIINRFPGLLYYTRYGWKFGSADALSGIQNDTLLYMDIQDRGNFFGSDTHGWGLQGTLPDISGYSALTHFACISLNITRYEGTGFPASLIYYAADICNLNQSSVDLILAHAAALGTAIAVDLVGGTNATPSAAGLVSKATIIANGGSVLNN